MTFGSGPSRAEEIPLSFNSVDAGVCKTVVSSDLIINVQCPLNTGGRGRARSDASNGVSICHQINPRARSPPRPRIAHVDGIIKQLDGPDDRFQRRMLEMRARSIGLDIAHPRSVIPFARARI